jgi:hypothetical protein
VAYEETLHPYIVSAWNYQSSDKCLFASIKVLIRAKNLGSYNSY